MGVVYEAIDRERGTRVALKTLKHLTAESLARLKREFRAMQDLHHPNLVSLGELVSEGSQWFFTMELVDGADLIDHVRRAPKPADLSSAIKPSERSIPAIEPAPLSAASAPSPSFDESRLRNAFRQLAEALVVLHSAGLVHRDVKSSNVRVAQDGRLVLLDFGLVVDTRADTVWTQHAAGTPAYMAPEQVASAQVGPEADWYALGVLLFEALTGTFPFDGTSLQIAMRKQKEQPPAPSTLASGVPRDLDELCVALLRFEPSARARGADVLRVLGGASAASTPGSHTQAAPFVGRAAELAALIGAFDDSRRGQPVTVVIEGESGVGKSALVRRFAQRLSLQLPEAVLLAGRCYERESVPYKAFDGVVDALARILARMGEEGAAMVPTKPAALVKVFPVLRRVEAIAERTRGVQPDVPGFDLRTRAFESLRELFTRLADRRPLVVVIDDAQWSDVDSLALLADLLRPPEAPQLMLVLTARGAVATLGNNNAERARLLAATLQGDVRRIELGPLPTHDASALATQLLQRAGVVDAHLADWTAHQAGGHPLFIDMIMRRADQWSGRPATELRLEDVLWGVIEELDAAPRTLLEMVAVAAGPLAQETLRRAASVGGEIFPKALSLLRVAHLVQTSGARGTDGVEPYHDRVRAAVLAHIDYARRAECHRRIAIALETSSEPDAEALVLHWRGAGGDAQTAHYAALAGDRAAEALAFDRAAGFFELALAKGDHTAEQRRALLIKLANMLESAGRGEDAARAYVQAAEGAPPLQRVELERAASVELIASGRFDDGSAVLRRVLAQVGVRTPRSSLGALVWLLLYRFWLLIVGVRFNERDADEVQREDRARIDALFGATMGFNVVDVILGMCLCERHLIEALRAGDRFQLLRAMVLKAAQLSAHGGPTGRFERRLFDVADRLTQKEANVEGKALYDGCRGAALYLRGEWKEGLAMLDVGLARTQSHSHAAGWQGILRVFSCWTLMFMGQYAELEQRYARFLADAERRGDRYTSVQLRAGSLSQLWLAGDRPQDARRHAREAIALWPRDRYLLQHWHLMIGEAEIALYLGDGASAYARIESDDVALRRSLLLRVQLVRIATAHVRGRAAIACAAAQPGVRASRLSEARRLARQLERERLSWAAPLAATLRAGVASLEGDGRAAAAFLRESIERAVAVDMSGYAASGRHQLGLLLGGEQGRELVQQAEEAMNAQGIRVPSRFASLLVPGRWQAEEAAAPVTGLVR
jgi:hypothetical protein